MKSVCGHYTQDGSTIYLPIGFIPDYLRLIDVPDSSPATNIIVYEWFERFEDDGEASNYAEGIGYTEGVTSVLVSGSTDGIAAYDGSSEKPTVYVWGASTTTLYTKDYDAGLGTGSSATRSARTATAHGTYIHPTTSDQSQRDAIFECVTASGNTGATEPNWEDAPGIGDQISDGSNVWERVNVEKTRGGYQGVRIHGDVQTDGQEMWFLALLCDRSLDLGDVDGWTGGIQGA